VPTDIAQDCRRTRARNFAVQGVAWSLGLFGVLRLGWFEAHAVLPLTEWQGRLAQRGFGVPALPLEVTLACSGADALALCAAAILAYPTRWRRRLAGAAGGIALILTLNTVRIGTLGRAAASPAWFALLHLYAWPALLTLAIAGYVFAWMRWVDIRTPRNIAPSADARRDDGTGAIFASGRFVWSAAALLVLFTAAAPFYLESRGVLAIAAFVARSAAGALRGLGVDATATGNVLSTARGGFAVTQECISTPLIPVYLAAILACSTTWRRRALAAAAAGPLFVGLGIARLLVVAVPAALIGSPLFLIHAFYQLLLAGVVVLLAAFWRHGAGSTAWRRAILGGALGGGLVYLAAPLYAHALTMGVAAAPALEDPQGAIAFLPAFQLGFFVALVVATFAVLRWRSLVAGFALLGLAQIVTFAALHAVVRYAGVVPHVRDVRAWALAAPLLVVVAMVTYDRPRA
jgi:exosortase/archaeosortase family protein